MPEGVSDDDARTAVDPAIASAAGQAAVVRAELVWSLHSGEYAAATDSGSRLVETLIGQASEASDQGATGPDLVPIVAELTAARVDLGLALIGLGDADSAIHSLQEATLNLAFTVETLAAVGLAVCKHNRLSPDNRVSAWLCKLPEGAEDVLLRDGDGGREGLLGTVDRDGRRPQRP